MSSINKVILIGNLGKDPEARTTTSGKAVTNFSVATTSGFGDKEKTEWHNIVTWEKTAEACAKYLTKGSKVYVEGRIETEKVEKDGATKYFTKIVAYEVKFLTPKGGAEKPADDGLGW